MDLLRLLHVMLLAVWAGVVLVEVLIELAGQSRAAALHFWTDMLIESPLLLGIIVTGALLLGRVGPVWPPHLGLKLACAGVAIGANLICLVMVVLRYRLRSEPEAVARMTTRIRWTGLGVPFGLCAAIVGFAFFHAA